jgi:hypothetical protein
MIYVAAPYSDPDLEVRKARYRAACAYVASLIGDGLHPISPVVHCHPIAQRHDLPGNWEFWRRYDLSLLRRCDEMHVLMLPGWEESIGVTAEIEAAELMAIPVRFEIPPP